MEAYLLEFSYLAIFLLLGINGAVNFPSSQVIYLVAGYLVSIGKLDPIYVIVSGSLGNTLGNMITYLLISKYGKEILTRFKVFQSESVDAFHGKVQKHGLHLLFIGKLIPSVKVVVPAVAGLARIKKTTAFAIFGITSIMWSCSFVALGYFFGKTISLTTYGVVMVVIGIAFAAYFYSRTVKKITM
jgi:membrane protein DedA with SNARE-associated domain